MVRYSIAICNYNMVDTIEDSLRSVIEQVTDEFEVLVVDGGSTDGSLEILTSLERDHENFRYIVSPHGPKGTRGADRALSVSEANGKYVLTHLDTDDRYDNCILDCVKLFHEIENQVDRELFLWISHIAIASKDHILDLGSYRNLHVGEDVDLFKRAVASTNTRYLEIDCDPFWESIGYQRGALGTLSHLFEVHTTSFQLGTSWYQTIRWFLNNKYFRYSRLLHILLVPLAYLASLKRETYELPHSVSPKGLDTFRNYRFTIKELEEMDGISIDKSIFSERGAKYIYKEIEGYDAQYIYPR